MRSLQYLYLLLVSVVLKTFFIPCIFATSSAVSSAPFYVPQYWKNTNFLRVIDLTTYAVRETTSIVAKNVHSEPIGEYYFPIKEEFDDHLSYIEVTEKKTDKIFQVKKAEFDSLKWVTDLFSTGHVNIFTMQYSSEKNQVYCGKSSKFKNSLLPLNADSTNVNQNQNCSRIQFYKITFDRRIDPNEKIVLVVKAIFTHTLTPYPREIAQTGRQNLLYQGNLYGNSAYPTEQQKTNIKLPTANLISYTEKPGPVSRSGNTVTYGFYYDIKPDAFEKLIVHYEFQEALLTVKGLRRDLEISHWSDNLAIEEHYNLTHDGAKLKGQFSRLQYHQTVYVHQDTTMARDFTFHLPPRASGVYYRDEIGNVSTSRLRSERDKTVLEFKPRYPLFGGWNYTWYYGYNVPLDNFLGHKSGKYILNIPFINPLKNAVYDKVQVRIILPEGASNVKVETPFPVDRETHTVLKTYFDSKGRYLVVLDKYNVVSEYSVPFQISYEYDSLELLRKPLVASTFFFWGFLLSIIYSRMEFTIGKK
ncbi:4520_t:CDS:2 [Acaulospora morrowiae]|uniref:Dolichyl-diphosphooligosaccharide--protein glycosyltransferase subunit 1 n=1 Tax=Acaulospora morrowiae TaxID=94023 RepID=A0A9N8WU65_9GLOM|nr:4520_t:CDS:2 [Acaulospora morrowiae]